MTKNRFLILFGLVCLLPVFIAFLLLQTSWRQTGTTNQGQWFSHEMSLLKPISNGAAHWRLAYVAPDDCAKDCQQALQLMQHIDVALGRKNNQLDLIVLTNKQLSGLPNSLEQQSAAGIDQNLHQQLILVAPQGIALLSYALPTDEQQLPHVGKALLSDLQKLLKFDRGPV